MSNLRSDDGPEGISQDDESGKVIRQLPSELFDAAADGLEAADMLLTGFVPSQSPNLQTPRNQPQAGESAKVGDDATSTVGLNSEAKAGELLEQDPRTILSRQSNSATVHSVKALSSEQSLISPVANNSNSTIVSREEPVEPTDRIHAPLVDDNTANSNSDEQMSAPKYHELRMEPSQVFDYVAEGIDAADAKFDTIPETPAESEVDIPSHDASENYGQDIALKKGLKKHLSTGAEEKAEVSSSDDEECHDESLKKNLLNIISQFKFHSSGKKGQMITRDRAFHQTSNKMNVTCTVDSKDHESRWGYRLLLVLDWFDTFLTYGTSYIIAILIILYTIHLLVFAGFYFAISKYCESSEPFTFSQAFAFSLQTATTTGYTLPQANDAMFFGGCVEWVVVIYLQCIYYLIFNGIVIGTLMLRYARADRRSNQIVFSKHGCIVCIRGRFYFSFQCFDLQASQPIIGATVRVFAILHEVNKEAKALWQMRAMRLVRPDDELGAKIWLSVPCICLHEIDAWSPLAPSILTRPPRIVQSVAANRFPQPPQRAVDGRSGSRAQATCFVCGATFLTEAALRRHMVYSKIDEETRGRPETFGHRKVNIRNLTRPVISRKSEEKRESMQGDASDLKNGASVGTQAFSMSSTTSSTVEPDQRQLPFVNVTPESVRDAIKKRLESRNIEIVCIIEGTDPHTAKTFQARHSYSPEDIRYDAHHSPCMGVGKDGNAEVNLSYFHEVDTYDVVNVEEPVAFASHT